MSRFLAMLFLATSVQALEWQQKIPGHEYAVVEPKDGTIFTAVVKSTGPQVYILGYETADYRGSVTRVDDNEQTTAVLPDHYKCIHDLKTLPDGGMIYTRTYCPGTEKELVRVDNSGTKLFGRTIDDAQVVLQDSKIVIWTRYNDHSGFELLDLLGNVELERDLYPSIPGLIKPATDGGFLVVGIDQKDYSKLSVARLTSDMRVIKHEYIGEVKNIIVRDFVESKDGMFIATDRRNGVHGRGMWSVAEIFRLDEDYKLLWIETTVTPKQDSLEFWAESKNILSLGSDLMITGRTLWQDNLGIKSSAWVTMVNEQGRDLGYFSSYSDEIMHTSMLPSGHILCAGKNKYDVLLDRIFWPADSQ
jgi:hypothetical protein